MVEMEFNLVKDSDEVYYILDSDETITKPTEEFFSNFSEETINKIKEDPEKQINESNKVLSTVYSQVQKQINGESSSILDIDSIEQAIDNLDDELFSNPNLQMSFESLTGTTIVTKQQFRSDAIDYIENKKSEKLADTFQEEFQYQNMNEILLDDILTAINEAADKYVKC